MYLDSSALAKLVVPEIETNALREFLVGQPERCSSDLIRVELGRLILRQPAAGATFHSRFEAALSAVSLLRLSPAILQTAANVLGANLRALDAIHLAAALSVPDLAGMVAYDPRLAAAAAANGLRVFMPGRVA
ncbi:MAG: type II toxin-antitoxin system VapC family toxin [Terriglobales bacterium]